MYLHKSCLSSLSLLWNYLTSASADIATGQCLEYSRKKAKTEMISTRLDNSNNIHAQLKRKKGGGSGGGRLEGNGLEGEGLKRERLEGEEFEGVEGKGGHIQQINKAEEINLERYTYMKAADLHHLFYGTISCLLLLTLP